jgi:hypothetical protein
MLLMFAGVMAARSLTRHPGELCEQLQAQFSS